VIYSKFRFLVVFIVFLFSAAVFAEENAATDTAVSQKNLHWFGSVAYGPREMTGTIFVNRDGPVSGIATPETLGLDKEAAFQFRLGALYKRWRFMLDYLPTNYTGDGYAEASIEIGDLPPIPAQMPVESDIDVSLLLLNVSYELLRTEKWVGALGVGFGRTDLDIALVPQVGEGLVFKGNTPFGYISGDIARYFGRFNIRAGIGWIEGEFDGARIDYGNYNAAVGWVMTESDWRSELVAGYRRVDFRLDYTVPGETVVTDISLKGPYIGLLFTW